MNDLAWQLTFGANVTEDGVHFSVWAPDKHSVEVELVVGDDVRYESLSGSDDGIWSGTIERIDSGARYKYRVNGDGSFPDPYSRYQPEGVHGPSEVIDPSNFTWSDDPWPGISANRLAIYELHVGTFTQEGTFAAIISELPELKRLGVTAIELMPLAQCSGERNWGYDGVDLFAPSRTYGTPDDFRRLVDAAHSVGLGVILDVVYNHLGPEGNYTGAFSDRYVSDHHKTAWGDGFNWDDEGGEFVRKFAIDNAVHWISEFHVDGLRLDAVHAIAPGSNENVVRELAATAREVAARSGRQIVVFAEEGRHDIARARSVEEGGDDLDGIWADDFHHEMRVALTNAHENYYAWYEGTTFGIERAINQGLELFDRHVKGTPIRDTDPASAFVFCIQNHDQIGNRPFGERLHHEISADRYAVASTLFLTCPETPLLFMGQEFAASTPFLYFTDHPEELGKLVTAGRREEFSGFRAFHDSYLRETIPDPQAESTFLSSKLNLQERLLHAGIYELYRELLRLRQEDVVLSENDRSHTRASALTAQIVSIHRWWGAEQRLVIGNFGHAVDLELSPIKALSPVSGRPWTLRLSTAELRFGGTGIAPTMSGIGRHRTLHLPARSAAIWSVEG